MSKAPIARSRADIISSIVAIRSREGHGKPSDIDGRIELIDTWVDKVRTNRSPKNSGEPPREERMRLGDIWADAIRKIARLQDPVDISTSQAKISFTVPHALAANLRAHLRHYGIATTKEHLRDTTVIKIDTLQHGFTKSLEKALGEVYLMEEMEASANGMCLTHRFCDVVKDITERVNRELWGALPERTFAQEAVDLKRDNISL